ncbi:replication-relaxation family protein [Metabacillus sp. Hm71]|uniref:replication-relaxation family protein n=1 Tax=Metabacillus sp. Hm71 TaxID=3450743 RepID=UPI003F444AFC
MIKTQERTELILQIIDRLDFATYKQIMKIMDLGCYRNVTRVIKQITEYLNETYIHSYEIKGKVFYLNTSGRKLIGSTNEVKQNQQIVHTLLRNEVFIQYGCPEDWANEVKLEYEVENTNQIIGLIGSNSIQQNKYIIPDAVFRQNNVLQLVEIDHTRHMVDNQKKLSRYAEAIPQLKKKLNHTPILKIYTTTEDRKKKWKDMCEKKALISEVYTFSEIK